MLIRLYDTVFANKTNTLPPVLTGVKPHMFKLKEDDKPVYETRPSFPPAKAKTITDWLHWGLECGLVEKATNTSYASRLILAPKYKGSTPKTALPDGIRVAWAGVRVNDTIIHRCVTTTIQGCQYQIQVLSRRSETILVGPTVKEGTGNDSILDTSQKDYSNSPDLSWEPKTLLQ